MLRLVLRRCYDKGNRVAEFHDVIDQDFDIISSRRLEFDLAEKSYVGGVESGVFKAKFDFAFSQNRRLIRSNQSDGFSEVADSSRPTIKEAKPKCDNGDLRDTNEVHHADEEEVARDFLANFFAEEGTLKIR